MTHKQEAWEISPNNSYFAAWQTSLGLEFVVYCERQNWILPHWITPLHLGTLFNFYCWGKA